MGPFSDMGLPVLVRLGRVLSVLVASCPDGSEPISVFVGATLVPALL